MAVFRIEKTRDYTVMSKYYIRGIVIWQEDIRKCRDYCQKSSCCWKKE